MVFGLAGLARVRCDPFCDARPRKPV